MIALYILVFVLGFLADVFTMSWHRAREARQIYRTAILSMVLETLTWLPVILFVLADDWRVAAISIVASGCGTLAGAHRIAREQRDPVVATAAPCNAASCAPPLQDCFRQERPPPEPCPVPSLR